jgi:hypothetical protein
MPVKPGLSSGQGHWNLEDYVMDLLERKLTHTDEFQALIRVYGRDKLKAIFEKWAVLKANRKAKGQPS